MKDFGQFSASGDLHFSSSGSETHHASDAATDELPPRFRLLPVIGASVILGGICVVAVSLFSERNLANPDGEVIHVAAIGSRHHANYFQLRRLSIPRDQLLHSGKRKDYQLALVDPPFVSAVDANFLQSEDRVIGVEVDGESRCYPLVALSQCQLVNDHNGGTPILVTYCPLSETMAVFEAHVNERELNFGVSGLVFQGASLFYDRHASSFEALWSPLRDESITNSRWVGGEIERVPFDVTQWFDWQERHPQTRVLEREIDADSGRATLTFIGARALDKRDGAGESPPAGDIELAPDAPVLGVWSHTAALAFPIDAAAQQAKSSSRTTSLAGSEFTVVSEPLARSMRIVGNPPGLSWVYTSWNTWRAFHPETEIDSGSATPR